MRQRVALVGCGRRFSSSIWPVLDALDVCPVMVVEPDSSTRDRIRPLFPYSAAPIMSDSLTQEILADATPDVVIISSPSGLHFEHAYTALSCRIPTFVEKPLACTAEQARILHWLGATQLAVSEQRMHRADLQLAWYVINSRHLGKIHEISYRDSIAPPPLLASSWRNDPVLSGGGVLLDLGYHTVGALQWLLGRASNDFTICAVSLRRNSLLVEENAEILCTSGDIEISLNIGLDAERPRELLTVRGSSGELRVERDRTPYSASRVTLRELGRGIKTECLTTNPTHDSKALRDFMLETVDLGHLPRHVEVVKFLELAYRNSEVASLPCRS